MKQLNISKLNEVSSNDLSKDYQNENSQLKRENMIFKLQVQKLQNVIQDIFENNEQAIPPEYLTNKEGTDVKNK
ncbi:hypothetical protein [Lactobacillus terrae]|uniref:hypothetical protein n=1 Tax=Lactobacillus terrae TaxID=2269374 RepID=UPI000C1B669D|nr:hypothetical protein [Lactobacillus terrae]